MDAYFLMKTWHQYQIDLDLVPEMKYIEVVASMRFYAAYNSSERLRLYLHRHLDVQAVEGELVTDWWFDQREVAPAAHLYAGRILHLRLERALRSGDITTITFRYAGRLVEAFEEGRIILGQHLPWVPFNGDYGAYSFSLAATCDRRWRLSSFGEGEWDTGVWRFHWPFPTQEILLVSKGTGK
jgi:hypothetical protein